MGDFRQLNVKVGGMLAVSLGISGALLPVSMGPTVESSPFGHPSTPAQSPSPVVSISEISGIAFVFSIFLTWSLSRPSSCSGWALAIIPE